MSQPTPAVAHVQTGNGRHRAVRGSVQGLAPSQAVWPLGHHVLVCNRVERGRRTPRRPLHQPGPPAPATLPSSLLLVTSAPTAPGTRQARGFLCARPPGPQRPANSSGPVGRTPEEGPGAWRAGTVNRLWGRSRVRGARQLHGVRVASTVDPRLRTRCHQTTDRNTGLPCSAGPRRPGLPPQGWPGRGQGARV